MGTDPGLPRAPLSHHQQDRAGDPVRALQRAGQCAPDTPNPSKGRAGVGSCRLGLGPLSGVLGTPRLESGGLRVARTHSHFSAVSHPSVCSGPTHTGVPADGERSVTAVHCPHLRGDQEGGPPLQGQCGRDLRTHTPGLCRQSQPAAPAWAWFRAAHWTARSRPLPPPPHACLQRRWCVLPQTRGAHDSQGSSGEHGSEALRGVSPTASCTPTPGLGPGASRPGCPTRSPAGRPAGGWRGWPGQAAAGGGGAGMCARPRLLAAGSQAPHPRVPLPSPAVPAPAPTRWGCQQRQVCVGSRPNPGMCLLAARRLFLEQARQSRDCL